MAWLKKKWTDIREAIKRNRLTRNLLSFLGFVLLAALFWLVMALNDNVQENLEVRINVANVPDTVTFITLPPEKMHVSVRDRGSSLVRTSLFQTPTVTLNFNDFSQDGVFRVKRSELIAALKHTFGNSAVIVSSTLDSLHNVYTTGPGKKVPVAIKHNISARNGMVVAGALVSFPSSVRVYSASASLDTVFNAKTETIVRKNLGEDTEVTVKIQPIVGMRFIPDKVKVKIPVEPLVKKSQTVPIQVDNVPDGYDLLLFPQNTKVVYYVQMSKFNNDDPKIDVRVDYNDVANVEGNRLPLKLSHVPEYLYNVELTDRNVEFTIVKH